ncbi:hypothetical protein C8J56DRAFT_1022396 [Mycena floridula]|nr:hypothetical protein C8J56DRAFT_1022396 [Mycena floridula]
MNGEHYTDDVQGNKHVLVATTLATFVLAGSALLWRTNLRNLLSQGGENLVFDSSSSTKRRSSKSRVRPLPDNQLTAVTDDSQDAKNARSKERRRRGKDPMKDLLKGGKKAKELSKMLRLNEPLDGHSNAGAAAGSSSTFSPGDDSSNRPRNPSVSVSSRSVSSASSSRGTVLLSATDQPSSENHEDDDDYGEEREPDSIHPATPSIIPLQHESADDYNPAIPPPSVISQSNSSSSHSSTVSAFTFESFSTRNTSPCSSVVSEDIPTPSDRIVTSKSLSSALGDPWAWDGAGPSTINSRKPPRFQNRSALVLPDQIPKSATMPVMSLADSAPSSSSPESPQSTPSPNDNKSAQPLAAPSLNSSSSTVTDFSTPKRGSPPRRVSTPSSANDASLSTQTQLASLRGALEAARMREEKTKVDMERLVKDMEMLRWESSVWKRREIEMQTQIHHLMHQLHGYAALYASMSPPAVHLQVPGNAPRGNSSGSSASPNSQHSSLPTSPGVPPLGMMSPNGMMSPVSMQPSPLSPFFMYPLQQPSMAPSVQQNGNLYSMMFPNDRSSPSASGSSSVESHSPDANGSPIPMAFDRGRRRTRTRTQTANARMGGSGGNWTVADEENGEEAIGEDERQNDSSDDDGGCTGYSDLLADAIFKRPESIRVSSSSRRKRQSEQPSEEQVEFTFPSLSELGNVSKERQRQWGRGEPLVDESWLEAGQNNIQGTAVAPLSMGYEEPMEPFVVSSQPDSDHAEVPTGDNILPATENHDSFLDS